MERFRPALFMNLRWNEKKLKCSGTVYVEVDYIETTLGCYYDT